MHFSHWYIQDLYDTATKSPAGFIYSLIVVAFLSLWVYGLGVCIIGSCFNQIRNIWVVFSKQSALDKSDLNIYTQSILNNTCPELDKLRRIKEQLDKANSESLRVEARDLLNNIKNTLEENESNRDIRNKILRQLKPLSRMF